VSSGKYYFPFVVLLVFVTTFLSACNFSTQSRYNYSEVGKIQVVKFGTVVKLRDLENGKTLTVAQNISEKDVIHKIGDRVIVQINGQYQRVLPANDLPTEIERPKGIKFKNE
jgi:outer membrane lipoprotein SlyB